MNEPFRPASYDRCEYKTKFKVHQSLWNPRLDVIALASTEGEICLKRFFWKTGWKKKFATEELFYSRWKRNPHSISNEDAGSFSTMCWSPCGSVLAVAFEGGVIHLIDVNDASIVCSLRMENAATQLRWLKVRTLKSEAEKMTEKNTFQLDGGKKVYDCEHLRTKDSDCQRDCYKVAHGMYSYCHQMVQKTLFDTVLIATSQRGDFIGLDVFTCGILLTKSLSIAGSFLSDGSDKYSVEVRDIVMLPNNNLQIAFSTLGYAIPCYDETAGFKLTPDQTEPSPGETTYLIEVDLHFGNVEMQRSYAMAAVRFCHILHLLTALRENFLKATADWDNISELFHQNVFGGLYERYQEETVGAASDFALDFLSYIISGTAPDAFSRVFVREPEVKKWKSVRDFVNRHIPNLLTAVNRHIHPLLDLLHIHLRALHGEMSAMEMDHRFHLYDSEFPCPPIQPNESRQRTKPLEMIESTIGGVDRLQRRFAELVEVAGKNWGDMKYVLQILSYQADADIETHEDEIEGLPFQHDFELLFQLPYRWMELLESEKPLNPGETIVGKPNWLKHRAFDEIGPLLGVCANIPPPTRQSSDDDATVQNNPRTVLDAIRFCFNAFEDVYRHGLTHLLPDATTTVAPSRVLLLERCHPESITKLIMVAADDVCTTFRLDNTLEMKKTAQAFDEYVMFRGIVGKSVIIIHRADSGVLQTYMCVEPMVLQMEAEFVCACSPAEILRIGEMGGDQPIPLGPRKPKVRVCDVQLYASASLNICAAFPENEMENAVPVHLLRSTLSCYPICYDEEALSFAPDVVFCAARERTIALIFERRGEQLKWFDLEPNALGRNQPFRELDNTNPVIRPTKAKRPRRFFDIRDDQLELVNDGHGRLRVAGIVSTSLLDATDDEDDEENAGSLAGTKTTALGPSTLCGGARPVEGGFMVDIEPSPTPQDPPLPAFPTTSEYAPTSARVVDYSSPASSSISSPARADDETDEVEDDEEEMDDDPTAAPEDIPTDRDDTEMDDTLDA